MASDHGPRIPKPEIVDYFSDKLREHGASPRGVDWNGDDAQALRFRQMARVIPAGRRSTVTDLGCGYGSFAEHLDAAGIDCHYLGVDASAEMVAAAQARLAGRPGTEIVQGSGCPRTTDYVLANGIFNVRLDVSDDAWFEYIVATLDDMHAHSGRAFAFNCLTVYSDADRMRPYLYYSDPCRLFDHCKRRYAKDVALWHDYGAYEFMIVVRKVVE